MIGLTLSQASTDQDYLEWDDAAIMVVADLDKAHAFTPCFSYLPTCELDSGIYDVFVGEHSYKLCLLHAMPGTEYRFNGVLYHERQPEETLAWLKRTQEDTAQFSANVNISKLEIAQLLQFIRDRYSPDI